MANKILEKPYKKNGWLAEEIEVDAILVVLGTRGAMDAIMAWGFRNRNLFPSTEALTQRCFGLKNQPEMYIQSVCDRASELELEYPTLQGILLYRPSIKDLTNPETA